jgi:hypothetical protein
VSNKSISDRKKQFLEDCCGGGGDGGATMSMGDDGYSSGAPAQGPFAGYDPTMSKKKKLIDTVKKLKKK